MFVKIKETKPSKSTQLSTKDTLKAYHKGQQSFAKEKADLLLEAAGENVTRANQLLFDAGLIKGNLIR